MCSMTVITERKDGRTQPDRKPGKPDLRPPAGWHSPLQRPGWLLGLAARLLTVIQSASARPRWFSEQTDDELDYSLFPKLRKHSPKQSQRTGRGPCEGRGDVVAAGASAVALDKPTLVHLKCDRKDGRARAQLIIRLKATEKINGMGLRTETRGGPKQRPDKTCAVQAPSSGQILSVSLSGAEFRLLVRSKVTSRRF